MPPDMSPQRLRESKLSLEYSPTKKPSKVLMKILDNSDDSKLLYHAMKRHAFWLVQRSKDYENGEITVFDKLLLKLWNEGQPMKNIGLLDLFLHQFVIVKNSNSDIDDQVIVSAYLAAQKIIENAAKPAIDDETRNEATGSDSVDRYVKPSGVDDFKVKNETALDKLIRVYHIAKADYYIADANKTGVSDKSTDKFSNVRFLRDTAENLLRCLNAEAGNHPLIPEVERVVTASCEHAERLAGGRKRIFEDPKDEQIIRHRKSQQRLHSGNISANYQGGNPGKYAKRPRISQPVDRYYGEAGRADNYHPDAGRGRHDRREHERGRPRRGSTGRNLSMEHIGYSRYNVRNDRTERTDHTDHAERSEYSDRYQYQEYDDRS